MVKYNTIIVTSDKTVKMDDDNTMVVLVYQDKLEAIEEAIFHALSLQKEEERPEEETEEIEKG